MRLAFALALAAALLAVLVLLQRGPLAPVPAPVPIAAPTPSSAAAPAAPDAPVASLRDTEVDGGLGVGPDGRFRPSREALALFDYFLSATGEELPAQTRARIEAEIARRLPPEAAPDALAFFAQYLAYRAEAEQLAREVRVAGSADLERRLQWVRELRRKHFGAELASTLFGDEERAVEIALERRRVASDASLSESERRAELDALEQELPASVRAAREAATLPARLAEKERALRAAGGGDAELRALREETVGPEAAERLAALDEARAAWTRRIDAYRVERDRVLADPSLDPPTREARLEELRSRGFDARERIRVRTLDELESAPPPAAP